MIPLFRAVSIIEGVSYLLLLATVVSYRAFDGPDLTSSLGPVHGILWIAYIGLVFPVASRLRWTVGQTLFALVASVVPFATFWVERKMLDARPESSPADYANSGETR